ncbi:hypothetical protein [Williamsia sp. CHRR-6]|uniref:hypothetical protein n=1 Tax=Williamsia sp. CHRR-6 TaxID=2835871 RepID=UPI001BDA854C|nr:hypothetical protein [Williamsia sp. CHRR-6]MBT0566819.1 hypothetical protein [Williamsia sp. CHRR-6]
MKTSARLVSVVLGAASAAAMLVAGQGSANAAGFNITFKADTVTTIAKTGQDVVFPTTSLPSVLDPIARTIGGTLQLPQANANLALGPLTLASFKISIVDPSAVTGTVTPDAIPPVNLGLAATQKFKIRIDSVVPLGLDFGSSALNLIPAGGKCVSGEVTANLTGAFKAADIFGATFNPNGTLTGTYTIPSFPSGCGIATGILNAIVAGPNNKLSVKLGSAVLTP